MKKCICWCLSPIPNFNQIPQAILEVNVEHFPGRRSWYSHLLGNPFKVFQYTVSWEADKRFIHCDEVTMRQTEGRRANGRMRSPHKAWTKTSYCIPIQKPCKIQDNFCSYWGTFRCRGDQLIQTFYESNVCVYSCEQSHVDCTFRRKMTFIGKKDKVHPRKVHEVPDWV